MPSGWSRPAFSRTDRVVWTRQLAGLVAAGLPIERALTALADEAPTPRQQALVAALRAEVQRAAGPPTRRPGASQPGRAPHPAGSRCAVGRAVCQTRLPRLSPIRLQRLLRLPRNVHHLRHTRLHAKSQFILRDARLDHGARETVAAGVAQRDVAERIS